MVSAEPQRRLVDLHVDGPNPVRLAPRFRTPRKLALPDPHHAFRQSYLDLPAAPLTTISV